MSIRLCHASLFAAVLAVSLFVACAPRPEPPPRVPNVLLVVLDTTRADAVGADGDVFGAATPVAPPRTPVLDRLAAEGTLFTHARSTSAWTVPAHGSLFTGLYPSRHGAHHEHLLLDPEQITLAELLASTHQSAGFSENPHIGAPKGFAQGFATFVETWRGQPSAAAVPPTDRLAREWLAARDRGRPFFLFVNFMAPHLPYAPPPEFQNLFVPSFVDPELLARLRAMDEWAARAWITGELTLSPEELDLLRGLYRAEVSFADARLGHLLAALAAEGELDHTLVVVVGDHGENLGDHGLMEHQFSLHDTLLRVPLVLRWPGGVAAGVRREDPVQLVDVFPTVLAAAGIPRESQPPNEGLSLLGEIPSSRPQVAETMRPESQRWRFERVAPDFDFTPFDQRLRAVIVRDRKLILPERGNPELYDLGVDPGEAHNLALAEPELVGRLTAWLEEWTARARQPGPGTAGSPSEGPELDEETRRALEALGYL